MINLHSHPTWMHSCSQLSPPAPIQEVHPFNFLLGEYTDELYEDEVKTCAQRFVDSQTLKALVRKTANQLFSELVVSPTTLGIKSSRFQYEGRTIVVNCSQQKHVPYLILKNDGHLGKT